MIRMSQSLWEFSSLVTALRFLAYLNARLQASCFGGHGLSTPGSTVSGTVREIDYIKNLLVSFALFLFSLSYALFLHQMFLVMSCHRRKPCCSSHAAIIFRWATLLLTCLRLLAMAW